MDFLNEILVYLALLKHFHPFGSRLQPDNNTQTSSRFCAHLQCCSLNACIWKGRNVLRPNTFHAKHTGWSLY